MSLVHSPLSTLKNKDSQMFNSLLPLFICFSSGNKACAILSISITSKIKKLHIKTNKLYFYFKINITAHIVMQIISVTRPV